MDKNYIFVTHVTKLKTMENICIHQCEFCFMQYTDIMSSENLFKDISQQDINDIIRSVHHQVRNYKKSDVIIQEDDEYNSLIILLQGSITSEMMNADGQVLVIEQLQAPSTLAPAALFSSQTQIPVSIVATIDCKVLVIPRESTKQILAQNPIILTNFLRILSNRVQFLSQKMKMLQFQSLRCKVAQYILQQYRIQKNPNITLQKTQQELSEIFGVARPSFARVIRELHNEGIINSKGKNIHILNLDLLMGCGK